jgi:hypothetical protein
MGSLLLGISVCVSDSFGYCRSVEDRPATLAKPTHPFTHLELKVHEDIKAHGLKNSILIPSVPAGPCVHHLA